MNESKPLTPGQRKRRLKKERAATGKQVRAAQEKAAALRGAAKASAQKTVDKLLKTMPAKGTVKKGNSS
jgi:hypothetical protein